MAGKVAPNDRARSHLSYYVVMGVVIALLTLLCCYACYFFINKCRELSRSELPSRTPSSSCTKKQPVSYPVQPVVRDSATAMAALCRQLPPGYALQGDQVFPTPSPGPPCPAAPLGPAADNPPLNVPPSAAALPSIAAETAR